ncbi:unnamed protein product, partial [Rotaria sp. Silwood1]
ALSVISSVNSIFGSANSIGIKQNHVGTRIGQGLISIVFYSFGIFVAYRYSQIGLRVLYLIETIGCFPIIDRYSSKIE